MRRIVSPYSDSLHREDSEHDYSLCSFLGFVALLAFVCLILPLIF